VIGRDPTAGVAAAPRRRADDTSGRVSPDEVPTKAEALAVLAGAPAEYRAAVALGLAGLRIGEVLGMTAEAVELSRREVVIERQTDGFTVSTPKGERRRTIIVPGLVAVELRRRLRDRPEGWLFPGGGQAGQLHRNRFYDLAWRPALVAAGLDAYRFRFHALRHFCASSMLADGVALVAVAGYLGNTPEVVSRVYAHWLRDDREVPAVSLDRLLAPESSRVTGVSRGPR
jgi:integrase